MINRVNRIVLGLIGLVIAAVAVVGLLVAGDTISVDDEPGELYRDLADDVIGAKEAWGAGVIALAVVLAWLGLWWAFRQLVARADGSGVSTTEVVRTDRGSTTLEPVAVARAVAQDLETVPGVTGSKVRFIEMGQKPHLVATVSIRDDTEPAMVREAAEEPFARLCHALGTPGVTVDLRIRPTGAQPARVS